MTTVCATCGEALDWMGDCPNLSVQGRENEKAPRFCIVQTGDGSARPSITGVPTTPFWLQSLSSEVSLKR